MRRNEQEVKGRRRVFWFLIVLVVAVCGWLVYRVAWQQPKMPRIDVADGIWLEYAGIATAKNPEFELEQPRSLKSRTFEIMPKWLQDSVPTWFRPSKPKSLRIGYGSFRPTSARLYYKVKTPPDCDSRSGGNPLDYCEKVKAAFKSAGFQNARVLSGPDSYRDGERITVQDPNLFYYGTPGVQLVPLLASIPLYDVPLYKKELVVEIMRGGHHEKQSFVKRLTMPNPLYVRTNPVRQQPQKYPAVSTDGVMEAKLRTLVSGVAYDTRDARGRKTDGWGLSDVSTKDIAAEGEIPTDYFVAAEAGKGARTAAVVEIREKGVLSEDWEIRDFEIGFGEEKVPTPVWDVEVSGSGGRVFIRKDFDVSEVCGPMWVRFDLEHVKNLGPDEQRTMEITLPKMGESRDVNSTVPLWDRSPGVGFISMNKMVSLNSFGAAAETEEAGLSVFYQNVRGVYNPRLLGAGGKVLPLSVGSVLYGHTESFQVKTYEVKSPVSPDDGSVKYEDYTTFTVELVSPKRRAHKFEFLVEPVRATGMIRDK